MDDKSFLDEVKTLISIGDTAYLDRILTSKKISTPAHFKKLLSTLKTKEDFVLAHQLCKSGRIDTLKYFDSKAPQEISLDFVDPNG